MKKILFGLLAILLLSGCEFNLENNIKDKEKDPVEENKITELSLTSTEVKTIEETFIKQYYHIHDLYEEYANEKLNDERKYKVTINFSKNLIRKNESCNPGYDEDGYYDICNYITYIDFNNSYNNLFGETAAKKDVYYGNGRGLKYNQGLNIYELYEIDTGGGDGFDLISKISKAEQDNEKIYIYQKVAFYADNGYEGTTEEGHNIKFPHTDQFFVVYSNKLREPFVQELLTKYLSKFDTYKWTFKKNANGTYMFESLEYVEQ